jgi:PEP-CTERM motif
MRLLKVKGLAAGLAASIGALMLAGTSQATALVAGSGWQDDVVGTAGAASSSSPVTFTVAAGQTDIFSLTDGFIAGDVYQVTTNGLITAFSSLTSYATAFDNNTGPAAGKYAGAWLNNSFSHLQLDFAPGTYSLVITSTCTSGCPAHFGDRLDVLNAGGGGAVPEPAIWTSMLLGFGVMGAAMRNSRRKQGSAAIAA